jgi:hypothetical protein
MDLDLGSYLNLFSGIIIVAAALPTLYMSAKITIKPLRVIFVLLSAFLLLHGVYHLTYFLGDFTAIDLIAVGDEIIEPLSYILLFGFAIYFARRGG